MKKMWSILVAVIIVVGASIGVTKCNNATDNELANDSIKTEVVDSLKCDSLVNDTIVVDNDTIVLDSTQLIKK